MTSARDAPAPRPSVSRRAALGTGAGLTALGAVGCSEAGGPGQPASTGSQAATTQQADLSALSQAGVLRPFPIQARAWFGVFDLTSTDVPALLDTVGAAGIDLMARQQAARLSITWGVGPQVISAYAAAGRPGTDSLPAFASDRLPTTPEAADLFVQVRADSDAVVAHATSSLRGTLDRQGTLLWSRAGDRGRSSGDFSRNSLGFFDGIVGPAEADLPAALWLDPATGWPGATYAVVRLMPIDTARFLALSVAEQEAVFGRHKETGAPLSGHAITDPIDLQAKSDAGEYDIANRAHARRAHPLVSGAEVLMLRRSYNVADHDESGLVFVSFQRHLDIFTQTQHSLDEGDALMDFTYTARSGSFIVLPAPTPTRGLGQWLTLPVA